ncbi:MAG: LysR family transcriptional regulator [Oscillospiraceae bacterium]|nr:LysR family transcriptional regulator [Oscillospiraceae bacterium]
MLQRIKYFLTAAEKESFSLAAQELYLSPQALTKQMGILERELGGELFTRTRRGAALTPLGRYAWTKLESVVRDFDAAVGDIRAYAQNGRDRLNLGIFSALPRENLVLPLVSYLLSAFPDRQIGLEMLELSDGLRRFLDGKLDLLLTNSHEEDDWEGCRRLVFGTYEARVVVSLLHPWAMRSGITAEDLKSECFIKMRMDDDHYTVPAEASFYRNIPCRKVIEARNFETMLVLLGQAAGFAVFPLAFTNMEEARIKSFPYPGTPLRFSTVLLYRDGSPDKDLAEIVSGLRERFEAE